MNIEISIEELRKRSIFIATPMYGGQCFGTYTKSITDLIVQCSQLGIQVRLFFLFNESLITRARNYCVDEFLRSGMTHLMFIDSDITFNAQDILTLLALQSDDSPYDVIGGPYPKKSISWEKIKQAVDKGVADDNPEILSNFVGDYVFSPLATKDGVIRLDEPAEVLEIGTGFMMVRRKTFEMYRDTYPEMAYRPDHIRSELFDGSRKIHAYFDTVIDPVSERYLSEDYMFCQYVRKAGGKVWLCPWMELQHTGTYTFGGSLQAIASIGATATADPEQLKKNKKK